eukprot:11903751-Karenia_brevis.AAC.1
MTSCEVCVNVLRVSKSIAKLWDASRHDPERTSCVHELQWLDSQCPGLHGAKLVCRPEETQSIVTSLRER